MPIKKLSDFARVLRAILDDTELFIRSDWARVLNVSQPAISQWVNDKTLPRPDILHMMVDIVSDSAGKECTEAEEKFWDVADRPSEEVSPLGGRMKPTIREYMKGATIGGLARSLREEVTRESDHPNSEDKIGGLAATGYGDSSMPGRAVSRTEICLERFYRNKPSSDLNVYGLPDLFPSADLDLPRLSWEDLLCMKASLLIGGAGSGKTSVLEAMHRCLGENLRERPLWLGSDVWNDRNTAGYVAENLVELSQKVSAPVFVDGLDECPRGFRSVLVNGLVRLREAIDFPIIVSSRPMQELSDLKGFENFTVASMTDLQSYSFFTNAMEQTGSNVSVSHSQFRKFICHFVEKERYVASMLCPIFLKSSWRLFVQHSQTPFWETDGVEWLVRAIINDLDREKNLSRFREEWASEKVVLSILGSVSYRLIQNNTSSFDKNLLAECLGTRSVRFPISEVYELLENQGWVRRKGDRFEITHTYLRDYFAAQHLVESSDAVSTNFLKVDSKLQFKNVLRIAAGLASDASDILDLIRKNSHMEELQKASFLAEVMSQPIFAGDRYLERSSDFVVKTLDKYFEGWELYSDGEEHERDVQSASWRLNASKRIPVDQSGHLAPAISALHRSRSGYTGAIFKEKLGSAKTPILNRVGAAMECEGKMQAEVALTLNGATRLTASVGDPHLH